MSGFSSLDNSEDNEAILVNKDLQKRSRFAGSIRLGKMMC